LNGCYDFIISGRVGFDISVQIVDRGRHCYQARERPPIKMGSRQTPLLAQFIHQKPLERERGVNGD
jgi:hypothetical protein